MRTVHAAEAKAWAETQAEAVSNKNTISLAGVSNIENPSHISSFTESKNAMNRIVQIHDYLFQNKDKYFIRSLLIAFIMIVIYLTISLFIEIWLHINGNNLANSQVEKKWNSFYSAFLILVIVVPLIENFVLIMIIKICDSFFENKEIISGILIAFLAGFGHTYY